MSAFTFPETLKNYRIHMVGIKGTGMAALAEILIARGVILTGSDVPEVFYTDEILSSLGIRPFTAFAAENVGKSIQLVIHSSAYDREANPDLREAIRRRIPTVKYTEALGALSAKSRSTGIAGVHGKTTTTALSGTILGALELPCTVLAGSSIAGFGNRCTIIKGDEYFVAETCEYQRNFLDFNPVRILLTSVESDHQDCFPTYENILSAFMQYIDKLPQFGELIYCVDDPGAREAAKMIFSSRPDLVFTGYGERADGAFKVKIHGVKNERLAFSLKGFGGEFKLRVPGRHNALNAAGAIALAVSILREKKGEVSIADIGTIRAAVESFSGTKRRSELKGEAGGVIVIDDYGHHPTAIRTTLAGLKEFYPGRRLIVDFMSHTYSRTQALLDSFASSFSSADEVILHKIYASARETPDGSVSGEILFDRTKRRHRNVKYFEEVMDTRDYLSRTLKKGDLFVTMGAGDNWRLGEAVLEDRRTT